jgi:uncharacterized C2H2 Zn-finger protein
VTRLLVAGVIAALVVVLRARRRPPVEPFRCNVCGSRFGEWESAVAHIRNAHGFEATGWAW